MSRSEASTALGPPRAEPRLRAVEAPASSNSGIPSSVFLGAEKQVPWEEQSGAGRPVACVGARDGREAVQSREQGPQSIAQGLRDAGRDAGVHARERAGKSGVVPGQQPGVSSAVSRPPPPREFEAGRPRPPRLSRAPRRPPPAFPLTPSQPGQEGVSGKLGGTKPCRRGGRGVTEAAEVRRRGGHRGDWGLLFCLNLGPRRVVVPEEGLAWSDVAPSKVRQWLCHSPSESPGDERVDGQHSPVTQRAERTLGRGR